MQGLLQYTVFNK